MRSTAEVIRTETAINTVVTAVIAALITWLLFRGRGPVPLFGLPGGALFGIVPGTFNFSLLVTLVLTLVIRGRVRRRACASAGERTGVHALLPANVLLRALLLAGAMTLLLVPSGYALAWLITHGAPAPAWRLPALTLFYVVYFAVLALILTPLVVARALRDTASAPA